MEKRKNGMNSLFWYHDKSHACHEWMNANEIEKNGENEKVKKRKMKKMKNGLILR